MDDMDDTNTLPQDVSVLFGLDSLPADERIRVLEDVGKIIWERVIVRILDALSETDKEVFGKLLEKKGNTQKEIESFLVQKVPHVDAFIEEETNKFRREAQEFVKRALAQ